MKPKKSLTIGDLLIQFGDEVRGDSRGWMADQELGELVGKYEKKINKKIKDLLEGLRVPEWDGLRKESQEKLKVMTSYGAFIDMKEAINQKLDAILKGGEKK